MGSRKLRRDHLVRAAWCWNVRSGFSGAWGGKILHPLSEIEADPLRIEERVKRIPDRAGGLVDQPTKFAVCSIRQALAV
jgi:hypothetical protein